MEQDVHVDALTLGAKLPTAQAMQLVQPGEDAKKPVLHAMHWLLPPLLAYIPTEQAVQLDELAAATDPGLQSWQTDFPVWFWEVPAAHGRATPDRQ